MLKNTLLLTASALIVRFIGMLWQVWLARRIGQSGLGLFQLIASVSVLAVTVAVSGIRFTTTKMVAEDISLKRSPSTTMFSCLIYAFFFGISALLLLISLSKPIAFLWLNDVRAEIPLRYVALSLPFLSLSTVIYGYFTAVGRVWKSICIQLGRELVMIAATVWLLSGYVCGDVQNACLALIKGATIADLVSCASLILLYFVDERKYFEKKEQCAPGDTMARVLSLAAPIAAASYAKSGLSTLQHILVPKGLRRSGLTAEIALSAYGVIQGMSLPVVLFPSCLMVALAEMTVPALTEQQICGNIVEIRKIATKILENAFLYSIAFGMAFLFLGDEIGCMIYSSEQAGQYIRLFALIVPVMYMDMASDGCLKGLGEMMFCMYVNIADAGLSALLVWVFLSSGGISAYLAIICFTELFNFVLSFLRLKKITQMELNYRNMLFGVGFSAGCWFCAKILCKIISVGKTTLPALIISGLFGTGLYALFCLSALRRQ